MGVPTMDQQWLNTYREEIGGFSNTIHSFAQGEIARKDYKGISGGFGSYAQHDAAKHMLRLRLPGGRVTPERLHFMAQAVQQYHVPFLKLTTCEAIQMHDLTPDEVPAIMEAAIPCGIITRGGGGDNPPQHSGQPPDRRAARRSFLTLCPGPRPQRSICFPSAVTSTCRAS